MLSCESSEGGKTNMNRWSIDILSLNIGEDFQDTRLHRAAWDAGAPAANLAIRSIGSLRVDSRGYG